MTKRMSALSIAAIAAAIALTGCAGAQAEGSTESPLTDRTWSSGAWSPNAAVEGLDEPRQQKLVVDGTDVTVLRTGCDGETVEVGHGVIEDGGLRLTDASGTVRLGPEGTALRIGEVVGAEGTVPDTVAVDGYLYSTEPGIGANRLKELCS